MLQKLNGLSTALQTLAAAAKGVIFALAMGMNTIVLLLDERMTAHALAWAVSG